MKKIILVLTLGILVFSCNKENEVVNDESLSFAEIETLFQMKSPFLEKSKNAIIKKYGTPKAYYDYSIQRKEILNNNKNTSLTSKSAITRYRVRLTNPQEGLNTKIWVSFDEYILDAAENNSIDLPYSDRVGASSTCVAKMLAGSVDQSEQTFLDDDQIAANWVLLCVAVPTSDSTMLTHQEDELY